MRTSQRGFTLVELLVVIAIIGLLVALLLPAVQAARESARRTECLSNLRQLAIATQSHHDQRKSMPTYWGWFPRTNQGARGSWFVHLLPYVEQNNVYEGIIEFGGDYGQNTNRTLTAPASPDYQAGYWQNNGGYWVTLSSTTSANTTQHMGHTFEQNTTTTNREWVGPPNTWVPQVGTAPQYDTDYEYKGIDQWSHINFNVLQCYSDPSVKAPKTTVAWRYSRQWSLTNYQANYNAWTKLDGKFVDGRYEPNTFAELSDGLSNTILFAEGMRYCDGTYRFAFWSDYQRTHSHNFGVDWKKNVDFADVDGNKIPNTLMFQSLPRHSMCNNWRVQGHHAGNLAVAFADGSTRILANTIARREISDPDHPQIGVNAEMGLEDDVWDKLLLPADGQAMGQRF
jgi:prepilin-type N-terminal cleavage/methylation domain-containing protein